MNANKILIIIVILALAVVGVIVAALVARNNQPGGNGFVTSISIVSRTSTPQSSSSNTQSSDSDAAEATYTRAQLAQHNSAIDCYTSYKGIVYDLSSFIPMHEGGLDILPVCGTEADEFSAEHPGGSFDNTEVQRVLVNLRIGKLID